MAPARQMAALLSLTGPGKVVRLPARYIKGGLIAGDADDDASGPSPPLSSSFFTPHLYLVYYHDSLYTYTHTVPHTIRWGYIYRRAVTQRASWRRWCVLGQTVQVV